MVIRPPDLIATYSLLQEGTSRLLTIPGIGVSCSEFNAIRVTALVPTRTFKSPVTATHPIVEWKYFSLVKSWKISVFLTYIDDSGGRYARLSWSHRISCNCLFILRISLDNVLCHRWITLKHQLPSYLTKPWYIGDFRGHNIFDTSL